MPEPRARSRIEKHLQQRIQMVYATHVLIMNNLRGDPWMSLKERKNNLFLSKTTGELHWPGEPDATAKLLLKKRGKVLENNIEHINEAQRENYSTFRLLLRIVKLRFGPRCYHIGYSLRDKSRVRCHIYDFFQINVLADVD